MRKRVADRRPAATAGRTSTRHRLDAASTLRRGHAVGAVVAALLLPGSTYADSLAGRVLDPQGAVVPQAELLLYERTGGGQVREGNAGPDGQYVFYDIPGGEYVLEGRASGGSLSGSAVVTVAGDQAVDLELAVSGIAAEVVVTASSTPLAVQEVAKVVDVIDSEEIALRNELSITEALRTLPGIRVQTLRAPGSYTTIQTRGLRGHDTALLIDGMRFRDAASPQGDATAFYESLTTVDTERIEVLRGSGSSLYGSSAMAGVINVTSRTGAGAPEGDLLIEGGGLGLVRTVPSIRGGLANDRFTYSGAMAYINMTEGVRGENPYKSVSPQGTVRYRFTPGLSATGRFWYTRDDLRLTESPAFPAEVLDNFPATGVVPARALPTDQLGGYRNTGGGQARGVEMSVQAAPSTGTNLRIAYTYTDSRSNTPTIGDDFFGVSVPRLITDSSSILYRHCPFLRLRFVPRRRPLGVGTFVNTDWRRGYRLDHRRRFTSPLPPTASRTARTPSRLQTPACLVGSPACAGRASRDGGGWRGCSPAASSRWSGWSVLF